MASVHRKQSEFVVDAYGLVLCNAHRKRASGQVIRLSEAQADAARQSDRERGGLGHACVECADILAKVIGD